MDGRAAQDATWVGERYAVQSGHHRSFDDWFLDQHPPGPNDRVVDAGCGSGEFSVRVAGLVPQGRVVGVEPDLSMLRAAERHVADNLEFRQGRFQELDEVCERSWADLVVSRAVLHWIALTDHERCYRAVWRVLRPGGWFHAESGGSGNAQRLQRVLDDIAAGLDLRPAVVTFPDPGVVFELLERSGFDIPTSGVTSVAQRRSFDPDQLLGLIRTQASVAYGIGTSDDLLDRFVATARDRLDELRHHDGSYDQMFVRLHVRCRRPG